MNTPVTIRPGRKADLPIIMQIFDEAREKMRASGNDVQWVNGYPQLTLVEQDIEKGECFVCCDEDGEVIAAFAFIVGNDPTYDYIEGAWKNDEPYGTIHRLGSRHGVKGVFHFVMEWAKRQQRHIRFDTHEKNTPMLRLAEHEGFIYCGVIYVSDGTPRRAFQNP